MGSTSTGLLAANAAFMAFFAAGMIWPAPRCAASGMILASMTSNTTPRICSRANTPSLHTCHNITQNESKKSASLNQHSPHSTHKANNMPYLVERGNDQVLDEVQAVEAVRAVHQGVGRSVGAAVA